MVLNNKISTAVKPASLTPPRPRRISLSCEDMVPYYTCTWIDLNDYILPNPSKLTTQKTGILGTIPKVGGALLPKPSSLPNKILHQTRVKESSPLYTKVAIMTCLEKNTFINTEDDDIDPLQGLRILEDLDLSDDESDDRS